MDYRRLGKSDLNISAVCLGTMTFGEQNTEAQAHAQLDYAFSQGVNFIDTAELYPVPTRAETYGRTEAFVGTWLRKQKRDQVILATKIAGPSRGLPWIRGGAQAFDRSNIRAALDASLQRLGTDHLDLYQLHFDDPNTPLDETLEALDAIVRSGRARQVGVSNFAAWRLARAIGRCEARGWMGPVAVQPRYNLLFRQIERDLIPLCREEGLATLCYNPLAGGLLSGKHRFDAQAEANSRFGAIKGAELYKDRYWHEREFAAVGAFIQLAAQAGIAPVPLAIAWVLAQPVVTSAILGASRPDQVQAALPAADTVVPAEVLSRLNELSHEVRMGDASR